MKNLSQQIYGKYSKNAYFENELFRSSTSSAQKDSQHRQQQVDNLSMNALYLTSPSRATNYPNIKSDSIFSKRSSACDLKKSIYPTSSQTDSSAQKDTFNSQNDWKNKSSPMFGDNTNIQERKNIPKSRHSLNSNMFPPQSCSTNSNLSYLNSQQNLGYKFGEKYTYSNLGKHILSLSDKKKKENVSPTFVAKQKTSTKPAIFHTRYPSHYPNLNSNLTTRNSMQEKISCEGMKCDQVKQNDPQTNSHQKLITSVQRLDFFQSQVHINLSSQSQAEENIQMTARFNFVEQKKPIGHKVLESSTTSLGQKVNTPQQVRPQQVRFADFMFGPCKGKGRYGKVYQAIHKKTGAVFAIKQIAVSSIMSMMTQFISEIKIQLFLEHPYITKVYGYFIQNQNFYIIMEYMNQGSLYDLIKKQGCLTEVQSATKLHQISMGLCVMHKNNVIHRDLKPENIVISFNVCKICDFSWATRWNERRQTNCGTLDYLSPQMIQGNKYTDSIDLWSMGVLLYEMLVGKAPFYNVSVKQTAKKIKQCQFAFPAGLSQNSKQLIQSLLKKDPGQRKQIDEILKLPFFKQVQQ